METFSDNSRNYPVALGAEAGITYMIDGSGNILNSAEILNKCGLKFGRSEKYSGGFLDDKYVTTSNIRV